jgi:CheY-like chemotaxis protein
MPSPRRRVLVVDDEPQVAAMLNDVLTTLGYAVRVAGTGRDGISLVPEFRPASEPAIPTSPSSWSPPTPTPC